MIIYGIPGIFDFQLSAMIFEALTIGFIAAYGLAAVWAGAQPEDRSFAG